MPLSTIKSGLEKYRSNLSSSQINATESYISAVERYSKYAESITHDENGSLAFIKIQPVKIENQAVFGTFVNADYLNEIVVCKAKMEDGLWVPDEDNILVKCLITQNSFSSEIFNSSHGGEPVTILQLGDEITPKYKHSFSLKEKYAHRHITNRNLAYDTLTNLMDFTSGICEEDYVLNKSKKSEISKFASSLQRIISLSFEFESELVREQLDKDFFDINGQILSSLSGHISNNAKRLSLPEEKSCRGPFEDFYDVFNNQEDFLEMSELLSIILEKEGLEKSLAKSIKSRLSSLENTLNQNRKTALNKGMFSIRKPSGSPSFLFGESRYVTNYVSLKFAFGYDQMTEHDGIQQSGSTVIMDLNMSTFQATEFLQSATSGFWTKCTISRFMNRGVKSPEYDIEHDEFAVKNPVSTPDSVSLAVEAIESLKDKLKGTSSSKKLRAEIHENVQKLNVLIEQALQDTSGNLTIALEEQLEIYKEMNQKKVIHYCDSLGVSSDKIRFLLPNMKI